ncbi:hypothetical protein ACDY97_25675 [Rhizobium mongolense]|uniref:hypothetical protein n=1 Tax=Rhizobium mongolense TaxID=57676 RepID=UPI003557D8D8
MLIADDREAVALDALDLLPVATPAGAIRALAVFRYDALKAVLAGSKIKPVSVCLDLFRKPDDIVPALSPSKRCRRAVNSNGLRSWP